MPICPLYFCSLFDEEATASKWDPKLLHWNARALPAQWMDWQLERIFQLFAAIFQGLATCGHIFRGLAKSGIYFNVYNTGFLLFLARPQHICLTNKTMINPWWWCCKQNLCLSLGRESMTELVISMRSPPLFMRRPLGIMIKDENYDVDTLFYDEKKDEKLMLNKNSYKSWKASSLN